MHLPVETEPHVLHTQAFGPLISIKIYREKRLVAGARNMLYLEFPWSVAELRAAC
jgi:hypothetical protein